MVRVVRSNVRVLLIALLAACGSRPPPGPALVGHTAGGATVSVEIDGDRIARVTPAETTAWLWPSIVDSHVHLAYWPVGDRLARAGIGAVIDLAAPEATAARSPLHVVTSGPMLTRPGGYPLDSWGADGYGIGCADAACVETAIAKLHAGGAQIVKIALDANGLDPALVPVAVAKAHALDMKVAAHALSDRAAALAGAAGVDVLAHTPVELLTPETIEAWRTPGRAVISTLAAFGGSASAVTNLRALRAAGVLVLYGTDLGNLRDAGPSANEIALLEAAGLDDAAITEAMTTAPIAYWNLSFGEITVGGEATFLVLDGDPRRDVRVFAAPREVWLRGRRL